ncbi:CotH kinase family protein [Nannocystis sp. SCPEA4]|uniref:CotH kinase family protein n=1 Tax=Nannocystis sp. SCPEA4 TaxID=2996787 RepID=UPI00226D5BAB|nr:CotH kinase family protein [Nannocystis sp. SCPEA4]MCY1059407.1 CotH kinase family protein [Nannocystis sp. SCPEA4]
MFSTVRPLLVAPLGACILGSIPACGSAGSADTDSESASTGESDTTDTIDSTGEPTTGGDTSSTTEGEPAPAGEPDYEQAFPQDRVARLDITIAPADWQAMLADMTDMAGEFGTGMGPGPGMEMPMPDPSACEGLAAGDACEAEFMGQMITGSCTDFMGTLVCLPEGLPGPGMGGGGGTDLLSRTPIYVECEVASGEGRWKHVGIRFKGNSSLAMSWSQGVYKLPLRLNFDKFEDDYPEIENQRFYGFESLSLSNGSMDGSLLRDKLGTDLFADAGIPAPATAFYRIFIDHGEGPQYFGLYTGIELPEDESFLDRRFGGHDGNLYKPDGAAARWDVWDPETLGKENNEEAADYGDAQALFDALHADRDDAAAWRDGLAARVDVDGFLHWLALNAVIEDWDVYGRMSHNYYMYADPADGARFQWIPWDHTFAFNTGGQGIGGQAVSLAMDEIGEEWPLIRFLLDDPVYRERYLQFVEQAAASEYTPSAMGPRFAAAHALIAPYVVGAEGEQPGYTFIASEAAFTATLDELLAHVEQRQQDVAEFLAP